MEQVLRCIGGPCNGLLMEFGDRSEILLRAPTTKEPVWLGVSRRVADMAAISYTEHVYRRTYVICIVGGRQEEIEFAVPQKWSDARAIRYMIDVTALKGVE